MKLITALIQPYKLPDVKKSLFDAQIYKMTVTNALGAGAQKGFSETYRGATEEINLLKKVKAIIDGAKTGNIGDGKIFITELQECIRIRTEEKGNAAIG